jgi:hypothetical protein
MRRGHIVLCGLSGSKPFFHIISHKAQFSKKKKLLIRKCVFWFSLLLFSWNIYSRRNCARYDQICVSVFMWSTRYARPILIKCEISRQIFEIYFFFFLWHYSPLWALACRTRSFHFFSICHQLSPSSFNPSSFFLCSAFVTISFLLYGLLAPRQTPNLEDQGIPFCLGHHPWPVWHGRLYQEHTLPPA